MRATVKSSGKNNISNIIWDDFWYLVYAYFKIDKWNVVDIDIEELYNHFVFVCKNITKINNQYVDKYFALDDLEFKYNFEKQKILKIKCIKEIIE